jgi:hypothetical protein
MRPSLLQHPREFQAPVAGVPTTRTGYHQWHRSLAAELGRFGSRDPLGYFDGASLYRASFVPNGVDPFGLQSTAIALPRMIAAGWTAEEITAAF